MPQLIYEGYSVQDYPIEVLYVQQGKKVFFAQGTAQISESLREPEKHGVSVVDSIRAFDLIFENDAQGGNYAIPEARYVFEGVYQRSETKNVNKRYYPSVIWESLVGNKDSYLMRRCAERGLLGHLEHPENGMMDGAKVAILTTALSLRKGGIVWGVGEALDEGMGKIVRSFIRHKARWGVSSRGRGDIADDGRIDPESYVCETWDAVTKPSTPGSDKMYPVGGRKAMVTVPESIQLLQESVVAPALANRQQVPILESFGLLAAMVQEGKATVEEAVAEATRIALSVSGIKPADPVYEAALDLEQTTPETLDAILDSVGEPETTLTQEQVDERVTALIQPVRKQLATLQEEAVSAKHREAQAIAKAKHYKTRLNEQAEQLQLANEQVEQLTDMVEQHSRALDTASKTILLLSDSTHSATLDINESVTPGAPEPEPTPVVIVAPFVKAKEVQAPQTQVDESVGSPALRKVWRVLTQLNNQA